MADINIGSDQLLTTTLNDNDRLTITRAETEQQVATINVKDFKRWMNRTLPYVGENLALKSDSGYLDGHIYTIKDEDIGKTVTFQIKMKATGSGSGNLYLFNVIDSNFVWGGFQTTIPITPTDDFVIYQVNVTIPERVRGQDRIIRTSMPAGCVVQWYKLEFGIFGTPWAPAPSEIARTMDYSVLGEQIVPGEFWIGPDGIKRQVYVRSVVGTIAASGVETVVLSGSYSRAALVVGTVNGYPPYWYTGYFGYKMYWGYRIIEGGIVITIDGISEMQNATYALTFKYTK